MLIIRNIQEKLFIKMKMKKGTLMTELEERLLEMVSKQSKQYEMQQAELKKLEDAVRDLELVLQDIDLSKKVDIQQDQSLG